MIATRRRNGNSKQNTRPALGAICWPVTPSAGGGKGTKMASAKAETSFKSLVRSDGGYYRTLQGQCREKERETLQGYTETLQCAHCKVRDATSVLWRNALVK